MITTVIDWARSNPAEEPAVQWDWNPCHLIKAIDTSAPGFLLTAIMALATAWTAANPFGPSLDPAAATCPTALCERIANAVMLIANAKTGA